MSGVHTSVLAWNSSAELLSEFTIGYPENGNVEA